MKKVADNITELTFDNTLTGWSIAVSSQNLNHGNVSAAGTLARWVPGYVDGFGIGYVPASARIERLRRIIKT